MLALLDQFLRSHPVARDIYKMPQLLENLRQWSAMPPVDAVGQGWAPVGVVSLVSILS